MGKKVNHPFSNYIFVAVYMITYHFANCGLTMVWFDLKAEKLKVEGWI